MATFGRGPQPARPGPAWRPGTRPPVTRKPLAGRGTLHFNPHALQLRWTHRSDILPGRTARDPAPSGFAPFHIC